MSRPSLWIVIRVPVDPDAPCLLPDTRTFVTGKDRPWACWIGFATVGDPRGEFATTRCATPLEHNDYAFVDARTYDCGWVWPSS